MLFLLAFIVFLYMSALFVIAQIKKDNSLADIGWGLGFALLAVASLYSTPVMAGRKYFTTLLVVIWGIRLALHMWYRHTGEDIRYQKLRRAWGQNVMLYAFFYIFMVQGALMFIIAAPIFAINLNREMIGFWFLDGVALLLWAFGFAFEVVGDYQLEKFKENPAHRDKIMKHGLWRYTRHPNYFGEICMWWALFLFALPVPYGWLTIVSPITITILLVWVSGIPLIEEQFTDNPAYQQYKEETNMLIPWFADIND